MAAASDLKSDGVYLRAGSSPASGTIPVGNINHMNRDAERRPIFIYIEYTFIINTTTES